jgi:hypothetical protein
MLLANTSVVAKIAQASSSSIPSGPIDKSLRGFQEIPPSPAARLYTPALHLSVPVD